MAVTVKHAAMGTKLRSMQGKMLTESDYDRLLKMSTVSAAAHYFVTDSLSMR